MEICGRHVRFWHFGSAAFWSGRLPQKRTWPPAAVITVTLSFSRCNSFRGLLTLICCRMPPSISRSAFFVLLSVFVAAAFAWQGDIKGSWIKTSSGFPLAYSANCMFARQGSVFVSVDFTPRIVVNVTTGEKIHSYVKRNIHSIRNPLSLTVPVCKRWDIRSSTRKHDLDSHLDGSMV
jgi:hypothetical protein